MHLPKELTSRQLDLGFEPSRMGFETTAELNPLTEIVGQPRAIKALDLGLGIRHPSYNIYVAGLNGTGKKETIRRELSQRGRDQSTPPDWLYVNNFDQPDHPLALRLPAGKGRRFKGDMEQLLDRLQEDLPKAFRQEDFSREKRRISEQYQGRRKSMIEELEGLAKEKSLAVEQLPNGQIALVPIKDDQPVGPEELGKLSEEERKDIADRQKEVARHGEEILRRQEEMNREMSDDVRSVERAFAADKINPLIAEIAERYDDDKVRDWLESLRSHMVEHLDRFREEEGNQERQIALMLGAGQRSGEERLREYRANLLVDNGDNEGAPVVIEESPNFRNMFGTIERVVDRSGKLVTDFTRIKAGSLLRAAGGYLVINLLDALMEPLVWKELKRTLKSGQSKIETYDPFAIFSTAGMDPEPIPLDVKLVVIGNPLLYHLLHLHDEDFADIFKVKAEFVGEMQRQEDSSRLLGRLVRKIGDKEDLPPMSADGVAELARTSVRIAGHREKITAEFSRIADLIREAAFWARHEGKEVVGRRHVRQAIDEKVYRSDWVASKIRELIREGVLRIRIDGKVIGQVNGLSVAHLGDYEFGRPSRVTASVGVGTSGVINIERESKLSGNSYDKGMLILDGYLRNQYAGEHPMALSASITMEQSYGMIDGDSASIGELLALLSVTGRVPLRQDIAVTGSVNQWGEIQAIGSVNEKIEGFFDICRESGLTGQQGVCIPASNVRHVILRPDVLEAIDDGRFHIWPVQHVDEALELFGGIPAGRLDEEDTFHGRVDLRLRELLVIMQEQRATSFEREFPVGPPMSDGPKDPRPTLPGHN